MTRLTPAILALTAAIALLGGSPGVSRSYEFIGAKWADDAMPISYCVNPSGIPSQAGGPPLMTADAFVTLVRQQFAKWQALPDSYITFRFTGTCSSSPTSQNDGINTVGWGRLSGSAAGVTLPGASQETPYRRGLGGNLVEVDIIVDDRLLNGLDQATALNHILPVIVLHEIGHFLGLGHSSRGCSVMAPSSLQLEFCDDDIAGARALYPGPERAANLTIAEASCAGGRIDGTFRWSPSAEADGYYFDITLDPGFGGWLGFYAGGGGAGALRLPGMVAGTPHYWRLWNFNTAGGGHSQGPAFVTPYCSGGAVVPAGPAGLRVGANCTAGKVVAAFNWTQSLGAEGYFVDLSLDPAFGGFLNARVEGTGLVWAGLSPGQMHYFRVFAFNANGGFHSYAESFRTPPC